MSVLHFTAEQIAKYLREKTISSREVTEEYLDRIESTDHRIGAFLHVARESALAAADRADRAIASSDVSSPWTGVPIAIKDVLCTLNSPTTGGSKILKGYLSPYAATAVQRLEAAGMVVLGKTNLDEFAMGGSTENSGYQQTFNPWDLRRTPGGSSGGSAACVAAAQSPVSLGTDTGGSIRQPAAFCGICGLKPTYGRVSRYGLLAFASSLDQIGPMAHTIEDISQLYQIISGHDEKDSTSIPQPIGAVQEALTKPIDGLKIGIVREQLESDGLHGEVRAKILDAIEVLRKQGATIIDIQLPHSKYSISTYYIIAPGEASSNLSRYSGAHYGFRAARNSNPSLRTDGQESGSNSALVEMYCDSRGQGFGPEVKRRIMLGTYTLSAGYYDAYYLKALKVRRLIRQDYDRAFEKVDCIVGPTTPTPPFAIGEKFADPLQMYLVDLYTVGANLAGIPALSLPCGSTSDNLPVGLQIQAAPLREDIVLQVGSAYHRAIDFKPSWPKLEA